MNETLVTPYGSLSSLKTANDLFPSGGGKNLLDSSDPFLSLLMTAGQNGAELQGSPLNGNLTGGVELLNLFAALRGFEGGNGNLGEEELPSPSTGNKGEVNEGDWKALLSLLQQLGILSIPSNLNQGDLLSILQENSTQVKNLLSQAIGGTEGERLFSGETSAQQKGADLKALFSRGDLLHGKEILPLSLVKNLLTQVLDGAEGGDLLSPDQNQMGQNPIRQLPIGQNEGSLLLKLLFSLKGQDGTLLPQSTGQQGEFIQVQGGGPEKLLSMAQGKEKSVPLFPEGGTGKDGEGRAKGNGNEATKAGFYQLLGEWQGKASAQPAIKETVTLHANQFKEDLSRFLLSQVKMIRLPDGTSEAHLKLFPEQLGSLDVKIAMHNGIMQATFIVDTLQGKELLEQNLTHLRHQLVQQGIQVEKMEILTPKELPYSQQTWQREGEDRRRQPYPWRALEKEYDGDEEFSNLITSPLTLG
ncbi:MAG: flagellar hook-length control protein FliK [Thermicanus sp.]|nr:flagellar hook-length control protein FliK [Thermicanus sp.]